MSATSRSADLSQLRQEGYDIRLQSGHLVMKGVPYVTADKSVAYADLVSTLTLSVDGRTGAPGDHTIYFTGEPPCDGEGRPLGGKLLADSDRRELAPGFVVKHRFSQKPTRGHYDNYHEKLTHYAAILTGYARQIDPAATAATFAPIDTNEEESVFRYSDTATSRAGIGLAASKLARLKVAIVGLGGTGSYVLDLIAKTHVGAIHLWDGDRFFWHNAFRSPGAPPTGGTSEPPFKVDYYADVYGQMRRAIHSHPEHVDESNVAELQAMDFVFLAVDDGVARKLVATKLEEFGTPFVDVGIGVYDVDGALGGAIRITTSTSTMRDHVRTKHRLPFGTPDDRNEYGRNIQVADLNALNASLAVIKWKKLFGFYVDLEHEHFSAYTIDTNAVINEDQACPDTR